MYRRYIVEALPCIIEYLLYGVYVQTIGSTGAGLKFWGKITLFIAIVIVRRLQLVLSLSLSLFSLSLHLSASLSLSRCMLRCPRTLIQEHLDARLTDFGKEQCSDLKATSHGVEKEAEVVVVSPLTRAIQTAMLTIDQVCDDYYCTARNFAEAGWGRGWAHRAWWVSDAPARGCFLLRFCFRLTQVVGSPGWWAACLLQKG